MKKKKVKIKLKKNTDAAVKKEKGVRKEEKKVEIKGIDVSKYQGVINWGEVKKEGIAFAILKITDKKNKVESAFKRNYTGAKKENIKVGVYKYMYAVTEKQAKEEANAIIEALKGKKLEYGVWIDVEDPCLLRITKKKRTELVCLVAEILKKAGYKVGIYCNKFWKETQLESKTLEKQGFKFWIARYSTNDRGVQVKSLSPCKYASAWQFTQKGKVKGIEGYVDLDVAFEELDKTM